MAYVKSANKAAWDALSKSTTESTIGLIQDSHEAVKNGVNVFVRIPKVGDIVIYENTSKKVAFIALDTYQSAPTGYTVVGVVGAIRGNKALIVHKTNASKKWADVYQYKVTGWVLDGTQHTTNVVLHAAAAIAFNYTASTLAEVVSQFNTWLETNSPAGYTYKANIEGGDFCLTLLNYMGYQNTHSFSGLTCTTFTGSELPENSSIYWDRSRTTYWAQLNPERFYAYYKTSGRVPTAQVAVKAAPADPVKQTEFNTNAFCDLLRAAYCADPSNPTDADYKNYLAQEFTVVKPDMRGVLQPSFRDGHANTYALVGKTFENAQGTRSPKYPAAEYCAATGYAGVAGLESGDWFMPSMLDLFDIIGPVTYPAPNASAANGDPLNRSLAKIGGSQVGNGTGFWASCRYYADLAWIFYGNNGRANYYNFYLGYQVAPVALFEF